MFTSGSLTILGRAVLYPETHTIPALGPQHGKNIILWLGDNNRHMVVSGLPMTLILQVA